jgi:5-methylcytosine-specific restriction endonuclease McrA
MKECTACGLDKEASEFYAGRGKCKECQKEYIKQWQRDNRQRVSANTAKSRKNTTKWRESNNRYLHKRRSLVAESLPTGYRQAVLNFYGAQCAKCGSADRLEMDHVVPLTLGGSNTLSNIQVLCKPCNASKKNRSCADYRATSAGILVDCLRPV